VWAVGNVHGECPGALIDTYTQTQTAFDSYTIIAQQSEIKRFL